MAGEWKRLAPGSMPPVDRHRRFLLMNGLDPADQIMCVAVRRQYGGKEPYILFIGGENGWDLLDEEQYPDCMWMEIPYPD